MCSFRYFKVFVVHSADGYGVFSKGHDKLAVAVYAYYVAFYAFEGSREDTKFDVIFCKLFKWFAQECYALWTYGGSLDEGLHHVIWYACRLAGAAISYQVIFGIVCLQKGL